MSKINRRSILYSIPMLIVFIAVASAYYGHYGNTIEIIKSGYDAKIKLIEQSIYNETKYTEIISRMAEIDMYDNMKKNSDIIIERYKDNPNVMAWDLKEMRNQNYR